MTLDDRLRSAHQQRLDDEQRDYERAGAPSFVPSRVVNKPAVLLIAAACLAFVGFFSYSAFADPSMPPEIQLDIASIPPVGDEGGSEGDDPDPEELTAGDPTPTATAKPLPTPTATPTPPPTATPVPTATPSPTPEPTPVQQADVTEAGEAGDAVDETPTPPPSEDAADDAASAAATSPSTGAQSPTSVATAEPSGASPDPTPAEQEDPQPASTSDPAATPTAPATATPVPAATSSPTTPTATPAPTVTPEPTASPTPESTATPDPTPTPTASPVPTASPTPEPTPTPSYDQGRATTVCPSGQRAALERASLAYVTAEDGWEALGRLVDEQNGPYYFVSWEHNFPDAVTVEVVLDQPVLASDIRVFQDPFTPVAGEIEIQIDSTVYSIALSGTDGWRVATFADATVIDRFEISRDAELENIMEVMVCLAP